MTTAPSCPGRFPRGRVSRRLHCRIHQQGTQGRKSSRRCWTQQPRKDLRRSPCKSWPLRPSTSLPGRARTQWSRSNSRIGRSGKMRTQPGCLPNISPRCKRRTQLTPRERRSLLRKNSRRFDLSRAGSFRRGRRCSSRHRRRKNGLPGSFRSTRWPCLWRPSTCQRRTTSMQFVLSLFGRFPRRSPSSWTPRRRSTYQRYSPSS